MAQTRLEPRAQMLTRSVSDSGIDESSLAKSLAWGRRTNWPVNGIHQTRRIRLVDLFCGCGAMTLGAWEAARRSGYGLDIRFALDWSRKPLEVFRHNFECSTDVVVDADVSSPPSRQSCSLCTQSRCRECASTTLCRRRPPRRSAGRSRRHERRGAKCQLL